MSVIAELTNLLISIISLGAILRIIICAIQLAGADDEKSQIKKRIRNALIFLVLALTIKGLKDVIVFYYS